MVFLGNGCGLHIPIEEQKEGQLLYRKNIIEPIWGVTGGGITRCCDSYLVSNKGLMLYVNILIM